MRGGGSFDAYPAKRAAHPGAPSRAPEASLLTSVAVVCRTKLLSEDAAKHIESCLDPTPLWTVVKVTAWRSFKAEHRPPSTNPLPGQLRLLRRIATREAAAGIDPYLKQKWFDDALVNALRCRQTDIAKWLVDEYCPAGIIVEAVCTAIQFVNLEFLQWIHVLHNARVTWWPTLRYLPPEVVAENDKARIFAMVHWLHTNVTPVPPDDTSQVVFAAAKIGDLDMLQWILELESTRNWEMNTMLSWAATFGHKNVLEWAIDHLGATLSESQMNGAVSGGQLETAQWLVGKGVKTVDLDEIGLAVSHEHTTIAKWAVENLIITSTKSPGDQNYELLLAASGNLHMIQELDRMGFKFSINGMDTAARCGHLDVVKWLHANCSGSPIAPMNFAAANNHLNVVKWLHANRNEGSTKYGMNFAASNGHLQVVQWLHANCKADCTAWAMDAAASSGHLAVVKWLHENRSEGCTTDAMDLAAQHGHLEVLEYLHENRREGYTRQAMIRAAGSGRIKVLEWLHMKLGDPISVDAVKAAARHIDAKALKWLLQHYHGRNLNGSDICAFNRLENVIALYSDGRLTWEKGAIRSGYMCRRVEVSCWMWSKQPEDMSANFQRGREYFPGLCEEFERIQDSIAPGWREQMPQQA